MKNTKTIRDKIKRINCKIDDDLETIEEYELAIARHKRRVSKGMGSLEEIMIELELVKGE